MIKTIATRLLELFGLATLLTGCGSLKPIDFAGAGTRFEENLGKHSG